MFAAGSVLLDVLREAWPGRSMFGFHSLHFIWIMILGEWLEPILRQRPFGPLTYNIVGMTFFAGLGALMGGISKAAALGVAATRRLPVQAESWN
jgi:hypothetical protein